MSFLDRKNKDLLTADRRLIESYLIEMDDAGFAQSTKARRLSSIKQFYRFAYEESYLSTNPTHEIRGPKPEKKLPKTLSQEEVGRLLEAAGAHGRSQSEILRNICLMQLLYATGMRVSELVGLPVAHARGNPQMLLVKGKGNKERMVPLSEPARLALRAWLHIRDEAETERTAKRLPPSKFLFPTRSKEGHFTRIAFYLMIKELAVKAGVDPKKVTPHTLRHAFATHLLVGGADLRAIQMMLGHADIATTEIYTHVADKHLRKLVFEHHPLASERA